LSGWRGLGQRRFGGLCLNGHWRWRHIVNWQIFNILRRDRKRQTQTEENRAQQEMDRFGITEQP
jgi:hypothetical protein